MAFNVGLGRKDLFRSLKRMPVSQRIKTIKDSMTQDAGASRFSLLTPAEFAELFPKYYQRALPDVGGFREAVSKKSAQRQEDIMEGLATNQGITVERAEKIGRTQRLGRGQPDVMDRPERTNRSKTEVKKIEHATAQQTAAYNKVKQGPVTEDSDEGKMLSKFSDSDLKSFGVEKTKDKDGKTVFSYKPPEVTDQQVVERLKTSGKGNKFFEAIIKAEGTAKYRNPYDEVVGYGQYGRPTKNPSQMTVREWLSYQDELRQNYSRATGKSLKDSSSAMGAFQIVGRTLKEYYQKAGLSLDDVMTPENQRKVAGEIYKGQGLGAWAGFNSHPNERSVAAAAAQEGLHTQVSGAVKPLGPDDTYTKEQKDPVYQQMVKEIVETQGGSFDEKVVNYEKQHNLPPGTMGQELSAHADVKQTLASDKIKVGPEGWIQPTDTSLYSARNARQCATLSKAFNEKVGHTSTWSVVTDNVQWRPGMIVATERYNLPGNDREGSGYHTGVMVTVPDDKGNFWLYDQHKGKAAGLTQANINSWSGGKLGGTVKFGAVSTDGGNTLHYESSPEALRMAAADAKARGMTELADQLNSNYQSLIASQDDKQTATADTKKIEQSVPQSVEQTRREESSTGQTSQQTPASATVEKPKGPQSFSLNSHALANSIRKTEDFKSQAGLFAGAIGDDTIINGFFDDARTKKIMQETGTTYDPSTGKVTSKNPDKLLKSFGDMDTSKILTPEKQAAAEAPTQTASIGEKLQREFGVASAQASTQGDAFAREEAYRKAHPYGPEMPTEAAPTTASAKAQTGFRSDLGFISKSHEAGPSGGVETISKGMLRKGVKDPGGPSYGEHQLSGKQGISSFLNSPLGAPFKDRFKGLRPMTPEFDRVYTSIARQGSPEREAFRLAQHQYNIEKNFRPVYDAAKKMGFNVDDVKVQEALYSMAMQHGKTRTHILPRAQHLIGKSADEQAAGLYDVRKQYVAGLKRPKMNFDRRYNEELKQIASIDRSKYELPSTQFAQAEPAKTAATAPKSSPLTSVFGSGGAAAAEATPTTTETPAPTPVTPTAATHTTVPEPTPTTAAAPGREFPKNKSAETPLPPRRDVSAAPSTPPAPAAPPTVKQPTGATTGTPQSGAPDESSTKNFLRSQGVPGASDGGSFDVGDRNIGFYPMDKKDNLAAVDTVTQQPLFTAKTGENINVDPMQNRIDVTPQQKVSGAIPPGTQMSEMNDAINTMFDMASTMGRSSETKQAPVERPEAKQNQVVIDPFINQATPGFSSPSLERAMSKARGRETGYTGNRLSSGTSIA